MSSVWRKIQHQHKLATKFRFAAHFRELLLQCCPKWQPNNVCICWSRRRRRYTTKMRKWEPTITDPYSGLIVWPAKDTETLEIVTTLYRDTRRESFDDKEWCFVVDEVTVSGKHRPIASVKINMRLFVNAVPGVFTELKLRLRPLREELEQCVLHLVLSCLVVKEGDALDDDMRSIASLMSVQGLDQETAVQNGDDTLSKAKSVSAKEFVAADAMSRTKSQTANSAPKVQPEETDAEEDLAPKVSSSSSKESIVLAEKHASDRVVTIDRPEEQSRQPTPSPLESQAQTINVQSEANGTATKPAATVFSNAATTEASSAPHGQDLNRVESDASSKLNSSEIAGPSKTEDLLTWCQETVRNQPSVKITNLSTSFRNGLAFCALIHAFRPDLIDVDTLSPSDIRDNCRKAFDAAAQLGVPRLIDPNDMVVMAIPDKIAVMTYVYYLRAALTGQPIPDECGSTLMDGLETSFHEDHLSSDFEDSPFSSYKTRGFSTLAGAEEDNPKQRPSTVKDATRSQTSTPTTLSTRPVLMTHNQLVNPFDSDQSDEEAENHVAASQKAAPFKSDQSLAENKVNGKTDAQEHSARDKEDKEKKVDRSPDNDDRQQVRLRQSDSIPTSTASMARQAQLRQRARELMEQFQTQSRKSDMTPEDDEHMKDLKERARRLIQEAAGSTSDGNVIRLSQTLNCQGTTRSLCVTPSSSSDSGVRMTGSERYPPGHHPESLSRTSVMRAAMSLGSPESPGKSSGTMLDGALDSALTKFRRFGSMRGQELAQSINVLSNRISSTIRSSTSMPKEISAVLSPSSYSRSVSGDDPGSCQEMQEVHKKNGYSLDHEISSKAVTEELQLLSARQKELDQKAIEVEKKWRQAMDECSDQEPDMRNEYLTLLNERNMITRREMQLQLIEKIHEYERDFHDVQRELREVIAIEESEKTEKQKRRIDELMDQLISIVNTRDELLQQLMAHEQGTEEDAELASDILTQSTALSIEGQRNCVIQ